MLGYIGIFYLAFMDAFGSVYTIEFFIQVLRQNNNFFWRFSIVDCHGT